MRRLSKFIKFFYVVFFLSNENGVNLLVWETDSVYAPNMN